MQYPISHPHQGQFAPYVAAVALSLLLLLIPAARANAENLAAPATAEEAPAAVVDPAVPPTEAADDGQALPVSPADPAPTPTDSSSSTAASEIGSAASKVVESAVQSLPLPAQPVSAPPSSDRAEGPAAAIRREVAGAVGSAAATAKAAPRTLDRPRPIDRVRALAHDQLQKVDGALGDGLDRFAPAIPRTPSLAAGGDGPPGEASPPPSPSPGVASSPPAVAPALERVVPLDGWLPKSPAPPAGAEFLRLLTPDVADGGQGGPGSAPATSPDRVPLDRLGQHIETSPPPSDPGPAPLPDLPQLIASGASPSFVPPIAALLALLALAAPAILRRFREAPGLRAPSPFVCALERPG